MPRLSNIERNAGQFTLPGGGIEFGEEPDECVAREVFEETGLVVRPLDVLMTLAWTVQEIHCVAIVYDVEIIGGELRSEEDGTTDHLEWFELKNLGSIPKVELVSRAFERYQSGFRRLKSGHEVLN